MLIGDVARHCGVSTRMLRHYDSLGLVRPTGRTVGGYREYAETDIRRIFHVESLRTLGLSLKQIARALEEPTFTPSGLVGDLIRWTQERLEREQELLQRLRAVEASVPTSWPDVLRAVELMRELDSTSPARRQQAVLRWPEANGIPVALLVQAVLAEPDPHVAGALHWVLAHAGEAGVVALGAAVHSPDVDVRRRAIVALAEMPVTAGVIAVLEGALADPDLTVRRRAAVTSGSHGVSAAVPTLIAMVDPPQPGPRSGSSRGTGGIGPGWSPARARRRMVGLVVREVRCEVFSVAANRPRVLADQANPFPVRKVEAGEQEC